MPGLLEGQNLELPVRNISEKNPERNEETINCFVKVKFRNLESLLSSLPLSNLKQVPYLRQLSTLMDFKSG